MLSEKYGKISYSIFDPTGNITALVESRVDAAGQPSVAADIMDLHPEVEQVGFVEFADGSGAGDGVPVRLRMAGGEFCGNATMSAAALYAIRTGLQEGTVLCRVSGAASPLEVSLRQQAGGTFGAAVRIPPALETGILVTSARPDLSTGNEAYTTGADNETRTAAADKEAEAAGAMLELPVVKLEGISHIIAEPDSGIFELKDESATAEALIRKLCLELGADCLGIMFLGEGAEDPDGGRSARRTLTPLVYVPGADTIFWENSCASGSAAAGMYLAAKAGAPVDVTFDEPAGSLRVESDPETGVTVLHGSARLVEVY